MMRITRIVRAGTRPLLQIEGRLTGHGVEELRMEYEAARAKHGPLDLDLSSLQFADGAGVELLAGLEQRGCGLQGRTGVVRALLDAGEAPLVERLRAGDARAFEALVRQHGGRMLATARRMVGLEEEARDVVQEAFLSAFRSIRAFEGTARLSTWLHRIVVNAALMRMRTRRRRPEDSIDELLPRFAEDGHFAEPVAPWEAQAARLERHETRLAVRRAIDRLPETYRTVLLLRDIEELDTDETAARLRLKTSTVKTRLHRARLALRTLLERELAADASGAPAAVAAKGTEALRDRASGHRAG